MEAKATGPTPPEVLEAIQTIADYLRKGGWCEAIISDGGGASFHLTSIYDLVLGESAQAMREAAEEVRKKYDYP